MVDTSRGTTRIPTPLALLSRRTANGREPRDMEFMITTSGLNSYAHTYLMPSGKMLVQANFSTSQSRSHLFYSFAKFLT